MNIRRFMMILAMAVTPLVAAAPASALDAAWQSKVFKLISANHSYPRSAQVRGETGKAKVKITISPAGKLLSVDLVQPTGSAVLDREAVRIPKKIMTYPTPPGRSNVVLIVPIVWQVV